MTNARTLVAEVVEAVRIGSSTQYAWFGRMSPRLPTRIVKALTPATARAYLTYGLAGQLYGDFYLRGRAEPGQWPVRSSTATRQAFERTLSSANQGRGYLDSGWQLRRIDGDWALAVKGGLELRVGRSEARVDGAAGWSVGAEASLLMPKELPRIAPGFYTACGDQPLETNAGQPLLRLYWNLSPSGAAAFVAGATQRLNGAQLPFRLKVLHDPAAFSRCDAGVVYLQDTGPWRSLMFSLHDELAGHLRGRTPVFSQALAPGLALAYDPGGEESFGQHRCRLLADALVSADELAARIPAEVMEVVERRFADEGVSLDEPHLIGPKARAA